MHPFVVLLAIGTALAHDTGRRLEMPVVASNRLEAVCIAERNGNVIVADDEYVYAKSVRPVHTSHFTFTPPSGLAVAV
ncbi:MAG TPA: hypothetical protein PLZ95_10635 [Bryobacteraceae bacterium]|nr:hypothetical protein [Bryobacteraceae bacterium]